MSKAARLAEFGYCLAHDHLAGLARGSRPGHRAAFAELSARAVTAFGADGAMEKSMTLPFGTMPGAVVIGMATTDAFTHGWDLARSTGQSTELDPDLAAALLERAKMFIQPGFRGEDGKAPFGPEVSVPESAPAADQLAGFLGRRV